MDVRVYQQMIFNGTKNMDIRTGMNEAKRCDVEITRAINAYKKMMQKKPKEYTLQSLDSETLVQIKEDMERPTMGEISSQEVNIDNQPEYIGIQHEDKEDER